MPVRINIRLDGIREVFFSDCVVSSVWVYEIVWKARRRHWTPRVETVHGTNGHCMLSQAAYSLRSSRSFPGTRYR